MRDAAWLGLAVALAALLGVVAVVARRGRGGRGLASGRTARLARVGGLSTRLAASFAGAQVRRLLAGRAGRARIDERRRRADAELVARTMGQMKGALMKVGQMLSFISDEVPPEYRQALASLQAEAPPMDLPLLRDLAERELGRPLERAFARFDPRPLAAASIGQVHRARLPSGEEVVVKIQYPGVAAAIAADLDNAAALYRMVALLYPALDPRPVVDELRERILEELDYAQEAEHQRTFAALYQDHPFIRVPRVIDSHSTALVLTSEYVEGRRFAGVLDDAPEARSRYGEILWRFVFGSITRHHLFNADPHPGNYLFDDAGRMVFLDFGCTKRFPPHVVTGWHSLVRAHLEGDPVVFRALLVTLGFLRDDAAVDDRLLYDYFGYFYEPFAQDADYAFTREYTARSLRMVFAPEGRFAAVARHGNMPRDFVFANRIQWGIYSVLAQLGATAPWRRIHSEFLYGAPPSTALGREDARWREGRPGAAPSRDG